MGKRMDCGVYEIVNCLNGMRYIGSSNDIRQRWRAHISSFRRGAHENPRMQNVWNKYGASVFEFRLLKRCDPHERIFFEQQYIDAGGNIYNMNDKASIPPSQLGKQQSLEHIHRRSLAMRGNKNSVGHAPWIKGRKQSSETKSRISESIRKLYAADKVGRIGFQKGRIPWNKRIK